MKFANLAYQKTLPPLDQLHDNHVIDLLCTPIQTVDLDNFPNLKRFRASRSRRLASVTIKNCPNLEVIELSYCSSLSSIHLENLPNLQALSLRLTKVSSLAFSLPSLKYLDISCTQIGNQLPDAPNLLAFDILNVTLTILIFYQLPINIHDYNDSVHLLTLIGLFTIRMDLSIEYV